MFAEEVSYAILKHITTLEHLCNLRYVNSQFNRIAREFIYKSYIFIKDLSVNPFSRKTVFREETRTLHRLLNTRQELRCYIALFEVGGDTSFACLNFSFCSGESPKFESRYPNPHEMLCICPSLHIISFERLTVEEDDVFKISPQYMRIEKIHHIQTTQAIEIAVRMEIREFSNFTTPITLRLVELTELKDKEILAPFTDDIIPLASHSQFLEFENRLQRCSRTFNCYTDATRIKFDDFYDYTVVRNFVDRIYLPKNEYV